MRRGVSYVVNKFRPKPKKRKKWFKIKTDKWQNLTIFLKVDDLAIKEKKMTNQGNKGDQRISDTKGIVSAPLPLIRVINLVEPLECTHKLILSFYEAKGLCPES